jgi:hypothetical protein
MPVEIAQMPRRMGSLRSFSLAARRRTAKASATQPPVMAAVRVPPSAWITSQSTVICRSPRSLVATAARSARPTKRWISWPRPPGFRPERVWVERGSMAYSAVTQPLPCFSRKGGTLFSTLAVQISLVSPNSISTEPSA